MQGDETMLYDIYNNHENGQSTLLHEGLKKSVAVNVANELAGKFAGITVEWDRESDDQHGYLNQDVNHEITGTHWS